MLQNVEHLTRPLSSLRQPLPVVDSLATPLRRQNKVPVRNLADKSLPAGDIANI